MKARSGGVSVEGREAEDDEDTSLMPFPAILRAVPAVIMVAAFSGTSALAQTATAQLSDAQKKQLYDAAYNQLGVLEHCQDNGFISADIVALQRKAMALIPLPPDTKGGIDAERAGRLGIVMASGQQLSLTEAATAQKTSVEALCKATAEALQRATAGMPEQ